MHILMRKDFEKLLARNPMEAFKITEIARVRQVHAGILLVLRTELECITHGQSYKESRRPLSMPGGADALGTGHIGDHVRTERREEADRT